jgi:hypothetical protein
MILSRHSLALPTALAFFVWLHAFAPLALVMREEIARRGFEVVYIHPHAVAAGLALLASLISLFTILACLAEFRLTLRLSALLLCVAGVVAMQSPVLGMNDDMVSHYALLGILMTAAIFFPLVGLGMLGFRLVHRACESAQRVRQFPLLDLFALVTVGALAASALRFSVDDWRLWRWEHHGYVWFFAMVLSSITSITLTAMATVLRPRGWKWLLLLVLVAPSGVLIVLPAHGWDLQEFRWHAELTIMHTGFLSGLLLIFRFCGFRLIRRGDNPPAVASHQEAILTPEAI